MDYILALIAVVLIVIMALLAKILEVLTVIKHLHVKWDIYGIRPHRKSVMDD